MHEEAVSTLAPRLRGERDTTYRVSERAGLGSCGQTAGDRRHKVGAALPSPVTPPTFCWAQVYSLVGGTSEQTDSTCTGELTD